MRGFVITILSISLLVILVVLGMSFRNSQLSNERSIIEPLPLIYAATLFDDVAVGLNSIVGPQIQIYQRNDSTQIRIIDTLSNYNYSSEIFRYDTFLRGEVASRTASNITTNFTNMSEGMITLFINDNYIYTNNHSSNESVFTKIGGTDATSYEINVTITAVRSDVTHMEFDENGTINVTIQYTDINGTEIEEGQVLPNAVNIMEIDYASGSKLTITIGQINGEGGSFRMKSDSIATVASWTVTLPPINETEKLGYEYDAYIRYVQGRVSKQCRIGK
ncbi:MAG: hypothetical protein KJ847_02230 [Firmicutes bacterium]|nr:hypothetical protein [Bacillota bacterium]